MTLSCGIGLSSTKRFLYFVLLFNIPVCVYGQQQLKTAHFPARYMNEAASSDGLRVQRSTGGIKNLSTHSCCICGIAVYKATFISKWNKTTHPHDFPQRAHFSSVIGGSHKAENPLWVLGSKASSAVKKFSEWGDPRSLIHRIKRDYHGIIKMGAVMEFNKPVTDRFRADNARHYLSIMSRITPSPDWFVGIDRLDLCNTTSCTWKTNFTVELTPIDAGTDSGLKFLSTNKKTHPAELIHRIYPNNPKHPDASFFNSQQMSVPPMAQFKVELLHTKGRCSRQTSRSVVDCQMSRWSSWTTCSNPCGRGRKERGRVVLAKAKNGGKRCPKKTSRWKGCRGRNCSGKADCRMKSWSKWSTCSKSCGKGRRIRSRDVAVFPRGGGKECPTSNQNRKCRMKKCPITHCRVSKWTKWSPCSKTCGKGKRRRSRNIIQNPTKGGKKCPQLREGQSCNVFECRKSGLSSFG